MKRLAAEVAVIAAVSILTSSSPYYSWLFALMSIYAMITISWSFTRMIGRISMGHSVLFALPAYLASMGYAFSHELAIQLFLAGFAVSVLSFYVFSELVGRTAFVFLTLVLSIFLWVSVPKLVVQQGDYLLGGEVGFAFPNLEQGMLHALTTVCLLSSFVLLRLAERSRFGYMMAAVGDDETASKAVGVNVRRVKLAAILISASISAAAGLLYGLEFGHLSPESFSIEVSVFPFIASLLSAGNPFLSVITSFALVYATRVLNSAYPGLMGIFYALVLIASPRLGRWIYAKGKRLVEED
ncbi:branched-chain amino acid ABC transporter permease [Geoglobus ahangari]